MFKAANPYDDIVTKATDENLTSENWLYNLDVCDKVSNESSVADRETGARNCVAAILKRLVHRSANVQLFSLTLCDALSKNCGVQARRELASRSFMGTVERVVLDRNTHAKVKEKATELLKTWSNEWSSEEEEADLGMVKETIDSLKAKGVPFAEQRDEPPPTEPSSEQLRAEDEELRKVLELSLQDQGGRGNYNDNVPGAYGGSSSSAPNAGTGGGGAAGAPASSGYVPAASAQGSSSSSAPNAGINKNLPDPARAQTNPTNSSYLASGSSAAVAAAGGGQASATPAPPSAAPPDAHPPAASRVRALYDFAPTEEGELAFAKGDVIRVLDSVYEHWWRGELRGEAGIFPVNYVEVLPEPSPADMQREAELEARIFAQANDIDRLLSKLRSLDPHRDNLAEDEELQELYQSSLSMRPKIVKLIDRYSVKVAELRTMNEKFVRARGTFDQMMEQSLAKYNPGAQGTADYMGMRDGYGHAQQPYNASYGSVTSPHPQQTQPPPQQHQQQTQQPQQQQQDYTQAWNDYYAQQRQGYTNAPPPQQQQQQPQQQIPQQRPDVNDPNYAAWYYAQQAQQSQQQPSQQPVQQQSQLQQQQSQPPPQLAVTSPSTASQSTYRDQGMGPSSSSSSSMLQPQQQQQQQAQASAPSNVASSAASDLHDEEKRKLFERARAEAEAYHRAHQQSQFQQQNAAPMS